jgi:hypothetical protein
MAILTEGRTSVKIDLFRHAVRLIAVAVLCSASLANAGLFRTYLSLNGNDGNPCTAQLPCRLLPAALAAVNDGGEIWMVDSANFNTAPVNIAKSVKILAIPGAVGSIVGNGGDAIIVNTAGDVTLRNLQVLNFSGGVNGINIQNAAAVQIEKTSIDGFTSAAGACIRMNSTNTVRLYVDDSFLRQCNIGIFASGTLTSNHSSVIVDNTRIERGFSATTSYGVWMQGAVDVNLRNSVISRETEAIHFENPITGNVSQLNLDRSTITRSTTALVYANGITNAAGHISIKNSLVSDNADQLDIANTAIGGNVVVIVEDSEITNTGGNGTTVSNSAADANTRIQIELVRSQIKNVTGIAVSLSATNGSKSYLYAHDSELAHASTAVKTVGSTGNVVVSLVRSTIYHTTTAIDHGFGKVRLDGSHIVNNSNDFVNSGSANIVSLGNNMVTDNDNTSGLTYITPTIIPAK